MDARTPYSSIQRTSNGATFFVAERLISGVEFSKSNDGTRCKADTCRQHMSVTKWVDIRPDAGPPAKPVDQSRKDPPCHIAFPGAAHGGAESGPSYTHAPVVHLTLLEFRRQLPVTFVSVPTV